MRERVLDVLQQEGFIRGYSVTERRQGISEITIELKYQEGTPVIREIQRVSRPGPGPSHVGRRSAARTWTPDRPAFSAPASEF